MNSFVMSAMGGTQLDFRIYREDQQSLSTDLY